MQISKSKPKKFSILCTFKWLKRKVCVNQIEKQDTHSLIYSVGVKCVQRLGSSASLVSMN
jgi:hypothetical protein